MPGKATQNGRPTSPRREFDPDDPDYIKDLQRPAAIKEDLNEMERRKRVRQILESKAFREELEQLIVTERQHGNNNTDNLRTLEQLSELIFPKNQPVQSNVSGGGFASHVVAPVADLRGADGSKYSKQERTSRNKFGALFRLIDLFRWSQGLSDHCSIRLSSENEHMLINPFGLLYHEITASSLLKVDFNGNMLDNGSSGYGLNDSAFLLHSAIYKARPDIRCVVHLLTPVVGAVTAMKCGLLPISQEAMIVGPISYHEFYGFVHDGDGAASIAKSLGPSNKVLMMRNNGFVICGRSIEEAFNLAFNLILACETQIVLLQGNGFVVCGSSVEESFYLTFTLIHACEAQVRAARAGLDNLVIPSEEAQRRAHEVGGGDAGGVNKTNDKHAIKWKPGELEWEAWMRVLDNAGFRTGHMYRQPILRNKPLTPQSDVEIPPAACAYGMMDDVDSVAIVHKVAQIKRDHEKIRWLNSPNQYQKIEVEETGANSEPRKSTKWMQEETSPAHNKSASKMNTSVHQFVPSSSGSPSINPKEFKQRQQEIKEYRRTETLSAGPQSKILEGVTWQEAAATKLKDPEAAEKVLVGAASKGIIDRDYRNNAQIYKNLYQSNPFSSETDSDIKRYMNEVEHKTRVLTYQSDSGTFDQEYPTGGSQSPESVSLMQAARDHQRFSDVVSSETPSATVTTRETTFDASSDRMKTTTNISPVKHQQPSSVGGFFQRSKSDRFYRDPKQIMENVDGIPEERAVSDDEVRAVAAIGKSPDKEKKKKKKFRTPSFLKSKKDKEKK